MTDIEVIEFIKILGLKSNIGFNEVVFNINKQYTLTIEFGTNLFLYNSFGGTTSEQYKHIDTFNDLYNYTSNIDDFKLILRRNKIKKIKEKICYQKEK